ncbi:squalene synthase HpnC [Acidihalobacter yilgarnensis]|uniref:Squalene synthase HpnC n=1 Tax=Acidihalobacter yilgarnensis TaxID=2819280 RepID=A0A1D8ISZ2_9GAMM|nr:squalene synthase HpnC [Acidihalobacter yilgarnensis]AOU99599.1 squalene synthase HpnC [Acidihalobacter yilgarnensis]
MTSLPLPPETEQAYRDCLAIASRHYENFPVASWLLPARLRRPVAAIYAFARRADDIADEGTDDASTRLACLDHVAAALSKAASGGRLDDDPVYIALGDAIQRHRLPIDLFHDLLYAFRQDVQQTRYRDFGEVMAYCRHSANPVGRLLLHLNDQATPDNLAESDAICTALQLINFYQDLHSDYTERGRIYLPQDEMAHFHVSESDIAARHSTPALHQLMHHQYQRADRLLRAGAPLGGRLRGRMGLELRAIVVGGARILHRLQHQRGDLFSRPRLTLKDRLAIVRGACLPSRRH